MIAVIQVFVNANVGSPGAATTIEVTVRLE